MDSFKNQLILDVREAFARLKILDAERSYLDSYVRDLAESMRDVVHLPYPSNFSDKPQVLTTELKRLSGKSQELLKLLSNLHQTTIQALPDVSARIELKLSCEKMIRAAEAALEALTPDQKIEVKNPGGRPPKKRVQQLAVNLAKHFERLTGKRPTITVDSTLEGNPAIGEFVRLVDDVFGIFQIKENPEYFAREAIKSLKEETSQ